MLEPVARKAGTADSEGTPARQRAGLPDEIFFSIIQKKFITPNDFASTDELSGTLLAFTGRSNATARLFNGNSPPETSPHCSTGSAPAS